jgi:hypothetical protein
MPRLMALGISIRVFRVVRGQMGTAKYANHANKTSLGNGFWCDGENGHRDGRAPRQSPSWWPCASTGQWQFGVDERGKGHLKFCRTKNATAAKSRSDAWKLASYEVAGNVADKFARPERTTDSAVPSGRISIWAVNQTLRVWLISSCPVGTKPARGRKRQPGRARSPAMSQPGGQWQFGVDERGERTRPRVWLPAPSLATSGGRKGFDGGVEPDSRGRLCSPAMQRFLGATPETATGTGTLPGKVPVGGRAPAPANGSLGWTNGAKGG